MWIEDLGEDKYLIETYCSQYVSSRACFSSEKYEFFSSCALSHER